MLNVATCYGFKRKLLIKPKFAIQIRFEIYVYIFVNVRIMCEILYPQFCTRCSWMFIEYAHCTVFFLVPSFKLEFCISGTFFSHLFMWTACVCGFSSSPSFCLCLCLSLFFSSTPLSFRITKTNSYKHCIQVSIAFPFILVEIKYYALTSYIFITQLKCK